MPALGVDLSPSQWRWLHQSMRTGTPESLLILDLRVARALVRKGIVEPVGGNGEYASEFRLTEHGRAVLRVSDGEERRR